MGKLFCLFLLVLWTAGADLWGQELRKGTYPDGKLRYEGYFQAGKPVGEMIRYYPDGKIKAKMTHRGDTVEAVLYSKSGDCASVGRYIGRKKEGEWKYLKDTCLLMTEVYREGRLHGPSTRFFASGGIAEKKNWEHGVLEGQWEVFYPDGKLRMRAYFKQGKLNGSVESYDYAGVLRARGSYREDLKEGKWLFYDGQGKQIREQNFHAGVSENAEAEMSEENRRLDTLLRDGKRIPDPAVFADEPEMYMKLTGMEE